MGRCLRPAIIWATISAMRVGVDSVEEESDDDDDEEKESGLEVVVLLVKVELMVGSADPVEIPASFMSRTMMIFYGEAGVFPKAMRLL